MWKYLLLKLCRRQLLTAENDLQTALQIVLVMITCLLLLKSVLTHAMMLYSDSVSFSISVTSSNTRKKITIY